MTTFADVQAMLDQAVYNAEIGAHGAFWRGIARDEFVAIQVFGYPLLTLNNSAESNIVKALRAVAPFGTNVGTEGAHMPRMPANYPPMPNANIAAIADWIDAGCPA